MSNDMTEQEIKDIRAKYQMSRKTFSQLLGIGEASLARYESGGKPTKANANLIRAAKNPRFMAECLGREAALLPEKQRAKAEQIVYSMVYFDDEGEIMDMTDMYLLTLEQEILSEHASTVLGDLWRLKRKAEEGNDQISALIFEDMISAVAQIKPQIIWPENDSKEKLAELRGKIDGIVEIATRCADRAA